MPAALAKFARLILVGWACITGLTPELFADEVRWISTQADPVPLEEPPPAPAALVDETPAGTSSLSSDLPQPLTSGLSGAVSLDPDQLEAETDSEDKDDSDNLLPNFRLSYIPGSGDDLGLFSIESTSRPSTGLPESSTMGSQPGWGVTWLNGPASTDLPPRLYQFTFPFAGIVKTDDWVIDLGVTIGWFTDGVNRRPEMFRALARAAVYYQLDEETQIAAGVVYLDRDDIHALPVAGIIFDSPDEGYRYELVFPRPRALWRVKQTEESSRWLTLTGELGGGSWAIKRDDRTPDVLTLRDIRLLLGLEFRRKNENRNVFEIGWVSNRAVETRTGRGDYKPPDAFLCQFMLEF